MDNSERAWRKHAMDEAQLFREMISTGGRKVMVVAVASEGENGGLKVVTQPEQATRQDVINFIGGLQVQIGDLAKAAGLNPNDYITYREGPQSDA